jgi:AAA family ATP:ADP antiporter
MKSIQLSENASKHASVEKIIYLAIYFFFVFGSYTLLKELKDSIFMITVGAQFIPQIKFISLLLMIPLVMIYGWLSEKLSRKNLVICYTSVYGIGSLLIAFFINHPTIGLTNTFAEKYRLFGWFTYLFLEGASPFLVSLSWSFLNSVSHPKDIENTYMIMTIMSKIGGALFACIAWIFVTKTYTFGINYSEVSMYSFLMILAGIGILLLPFILIIMKKRLPEKDFIGYNKENDKKKTEGNFASNGFGLKFFLKDKYVLGIFGMMFFWEIVNFTFNNLRLNIAFSQAEKITEISAFLFKTTMITHLTGFILVVFGTTLFIKFLGERISLLLIPILTGGAVLTFLYFQNPLSVIIVYPFIAAINYSLSRPLRESLFIITSKSIQFSTKSWMDSFGQKFSKTCGSLYTIVLQYLPRSIIYHFQIGFFCLLIALWTILAYFLGKKWQSTIDKNKVIS